jgi:hypothetical protein
MISTALTITLVVLQADPSQPARNPIAPSLPVLTKEQEARIQLVIDRFILADIGVLKGEEARAATLSFEALGMESVPFLIDGLNRASQMNQSCPVLTIGKKLQKLLNTTEDQELLEFAIDNIGAGVRQTQYGRALEDLRFQARLRKNYLARRPPPPKTPRTMATDELVRLAGSERGVKLMPILTELETRKGPEVITALAVAATSSEADVRKAGRDLLERHLERQGVAVVKERLKDDNAEIRRAAVRAASQQRPPMGAELIAALADPQAEVRDAAHQALVKLNRGEDLGPEGAEPSASQIAAAQFRWREWWAKWR